MSQKENRNSLCKCGSGKKFKKCCYNKKPREQYHYFEMNEPVAINKFKIGPHGIELLKGNEVVQPKSSYTQSQYTRDNKKPKIINRQYHHENIKLDNISYLKSFSSVFAIDTNTKLINGKKHSVGVVIKAELSDRDEASSNLILSSPFKIHFHSLNDQNENYTWHQFIFHEQNSLKLDHRVCFIVDSDLGNLNEYNNRKKPFFNNFYLPKNIELMFATSDTGKEHIPNFLISECDRISNDIFENLLTDLI